MAPNSVIDSPKIRCQITVGRHNFVFRLRRMEDVG